MVKMLRGTALAVLVLLMLVPVLTTTPTQAAAAGPESGVGKRAVWVWTRPAPKTLVAWAVKQKVGELFVSVGPGLASSSDLGWVRSVSSRARASGIRVAALGGDPRWIDRPQDALAWQESALSTGLFDGVHVDVEPWGHPDWGTRRDELVAGYLQVLRSLSEATTLRFEADIAFWLHTLTTATGQSLERAVMEVVDAVTVLSYRNPATGPDSITDLGAQALQSAAAAGIRCRFGVETRYLGSDPVARKQTFHGLSVSTMLRALADVDAHVGGNASYNGMAVHDYDGWRAL